MDKLLDYFVPATKKELADYLSEFYQEDFLHFYGMKKKQLLAIYINTRKRMGR